MKMTTKLGLISLSIFSVGALSACQSTQSQSLDNNNDRHRHVQRTTEQKQQHQTQRTERRQAFAQMQKACDGKKMGENVQLQVGDKSIAGQCQMTFKPDHQAQSGHKVRSEHKTQSEHKGEHQAEHGSHQKMHMAGKTMQHQSLEHMTPAQREQAKQQWSTKRAQHHAEWQALQKACDGQAAGKTIQAKMGDQLINGQCLVKFQPNENAMNVLRTNAADQS